MTDKRQIWNFIYFIRLPLEEESDTSKIKDPDWELMYRLSLSHNVAALGYAAARIMKDKGSSISEELLRKWKEKSDQSTMQCLYQQAEQEELAVAFEEAGIPLIFLKGSVLRDWYPAPELRSMSDIDVLIHEEDAERAADVVRQLGYCIREHYRNEEIYYKEPALTLEIHKTLFWKSDEWNDHFRTVWERREYYSDGEKKICTMELKDFYIHLLGHFVQHMETGGIGIRVFLDIDIFRKRNSECVHSDEMKILLRKFGFEKLDANLERLFSAWNDENTSDEFTDEWTEFIVDCGAYGDVDNFIIRNAAFDSDVSAEGYRQKVHYIFRRLFPTYYEMCIMYSGAKRGIYTYPFYWLIRLVRNGIMRYSLVKNEVHKMQKLNSGQVRKLNNLYQKIGVSVKKE